MKFNVAIIVAFALWIPQTWGGNQMMNTVGSERPHAAPVNAQDESVPRYTREALNKVISAADMALFAGQPEEALMGYGLATIMTVELGTPGKSGYLAYRHGTAHWALYEMHGTADYAKAAIKIWQGALTSCDVCGYTESFRALISYDLGLAYLALTGVEDAAGNVRKAVELLDSAIPDLGEPIPNAAHRDLRK